MSDPCEIPNVPPLDKQDGVAQMAVLDDEPRWGVSSGLLASKTMNMSHAWR